MKIVDAFVIAAVFITSLLLGTAVLRDLSVNTISYTLPVAAMAACGQGLTAPGSVTPEFASFAKREIASTSCAAVLGTSPPRPADAFSMGYRYAIYSVAAAMRIGGLSWTTLDRYVATLFALSMTLTYLLFRLMVGPLLSVAGVGALLFSNHLLALGFDLRDYGKQIWFAMLWLIIGWLLARGLRGVTRAIYVPACVAGAALGIGVGFRGDLLVFLPAFIAVIVLALPGWTTRVLATKAVATGVFVAVFGVTAAPILTTLGSGSNFAHFAVLGLSRPMTEAMGIDPPAYDVGDFYADGFAQAIVGTRALAHDEPEVGALYSTLYDRQGTALVMDVVRHFPADFLTRGLGATRQVLAYPFDPIVEWDAENLPALNRGFVPPRLTIRRVRIGNRLRGWELYLAAIAFLAVAVRDIRAAIAGTSLVLYFCGYSLIQFQRRHTFHLDVVAVVIVIVAAGAVVPVLRWFARERANARPLRELAMDAARRLWPAAAVGLSLVIAAWAVLWVARAQQQREVTTLLAATIDVPWSPADGPREPLAPFLEQRHQPLTQWFALKLRELDPQHTGDWWKSAMLVRLSPPKDREVTADAANSIRASYMLVEVGGAGCAAGTVPLAALYSSTTPTIDSDYTRAFYPAVDGSAGLTRVMLPIVEAPGVSRFEGFAVASDRAACVRRVFRASRLDAIPLPMVYAVLPDNWRSTALFQRLTSRRNP